VSGGEHAIRNSVALSRMEHVGCLRISGEDAFDVLDRICPKDLYLRDGQMLHTLLLSERAFPLADLYVCRDDDDYILLAEGMGPGGIEDFVRNFAPGSPRIFFEDLSLSHALLSLNGPYAWEILGELLGPEVIGLPYLTFYRIGRFVCFRAGKTGEYGYDLLVPSGEAGAVEERLMEIGRAFDIGRAGLDALDQCAMENWFFNIRREGRVEVTPIELQLQWRVSYRKSYVGSKALSERRRAGPTERLTCVLSETALAAGDPVEHEDRKAGRMVNAGFSSMRGDWVGLALVEISLAFPGLRFGAVRTVSPPVLNNRSLHVSPQAHSYRTRHEDFFPPVVRT
jgi:glycine cleavage system aminomethyltransferase T